MKTFVGIDNGLSGAIAIIKNKDIIIHDMPVYKSTTGKRKYDLKSINSILKELASSDCFAVVEQAQPFPGQGVVSMFSTGYCYGSMLMCLTAHAIPFQIVPSQRWKKEYSLKGLEKDAAIPVAQRLFPKAEFTTPRGRMLDGRADAAILADYAKRFYELSPI
jgi:dienelactone hydrolase